MLFLYFQHKIKVSHCTWSIWLFEFLFWFSSAILLSKIKSLFFSLWSKTCQILHVIFESTSQFSFKFCISLQYIQTLYTLVRSSPLKCKCWGFWVLGSKFVKFVMSSLNWQVKSSSNFASPFIVMTCNSPVNFKLIHLNKRIPSKSQFWDFPLLYWKFAKFHVSFSKAQVSFSSNFASIIFT